MIGYTDLDLSSGARFQPSTERTCTDPCGHACMCVYSLYVHILDVSVVGVCSSCCDMAGAGVMEGSFQ